MRCGSFRNVVSTGAALAIAGLFVAAAPATATYGVPHTALDASTQPCLGDAHEMLTPVETRSRLVAGRRYLVGTWWPVDDSLESVELAAANGSAVLADRVLMGPNDDSGVADTSTSFVAAGAGSQVSETVVARYDDPGGARCYTLGRTLVPVIAGSAFGGAPKIQPTHTTGPDGGDDYGTVRFRIPWHAKCDQSWRTSPIILQVRHVGHSWATAGSVDQCAGWTRLTHGYEFALGFETGEPGNDLVFWSGGIPGTHDYDFVIRRATPALAPTSKVLSHGRIRVVNIGHPSRRVYAWDGSQSNDEYWNFCVNEARQTWMDHGNAYCVTDAYTETRTSYSVR